MKMTRRTALAAALAVPLFAGPALAQTQITIQHALPTDSHAGAGATGVKEAFERLTNNRYRVVTQRNDNEREMVESVQIGTIDCTVTSTGPVGNFGPEVRVFDVPFLFRDKAHAHGVLDSEIGQGVLKRFEARGLVGAIWMENGFRHVTNSQRPVRTPEDLAGLKLRTMENRVHMEAFSDLGAAPHGTRVRRASPRDLHDRGWRQQRPGFREKDLACQHGMRTCSFDPRSTLRRGRRCH